MNPDEFSAQQSERLIKVGENQWAFNPRPLPPDIAFDGDLTNSLADAAMALGNLNGTAEQFVNPALFIDFFVKREAVLSSQIEGTRATLYDLYEGQSGLLEQPNDPTGDPELREVMNYVLALFYGVSRLKDLPL